MGGSSSDNGQPADTRAGIFARVWDLYDQGKVLVACAWCGRIRLDEGWVEPPTSAITAIDAPNLLSHSICEDCTQSAVGSVRVA